MNSRRRRSDGSFGYGLNLKPDSSRTLSSNTPQTNVKVQVSAPNSGPAFAPAYPDKQPIALPMNYWAPEGAEGVDPRRLINVNPGQSVVIWSLTAQENEAITFIKYGIFTDALDASLVEFIPRVNGKRILRYHGNPMNNFKLNLSLGPNLAENNMIPCQIYLKPFDTITWTVINNDVVVNPMGVRMSGFVDLSLTRKTMPVG